MNLYIVFIGISPGVVKMTLDFSIPRSCYSNGMSPWCMTTVANSLKCSVVTAKFPKECHGLNQAWVVCSMYTQQHEVKIRHSTNPGPLIRHELGYATTSMDFRYAQEMDFNQNGGFSFLWSHIVHLVGLKLPYISLPIFPICFFLRLCLYNILNQVPCEGLCHFAPDCSSWGVPCRHTSGRSVINPHGHTGYSFVSSANRMVARTFSLIMITSWWWQSIWFETQCQLFPVITIHWGEP